VALIGDQAWTTRIWRVSSTAGTSRGVHGLVRVLHQTLGAGDGARYVEAPVEAAEILRGLERLLERGLREAQGGAQALELALIDPAFRYSR